MPLTFSGDKSGWLHGVPLPLPSVPLLVALPGGGWLTTLAMMGCGSRGDFFCRRSLPMVHLVRGLLDATPGTSEYPESELGLRNTASGLLSLFHIFNCRRSILDFFHVLTSPGKWRHGCILQANERVIPWSFRCRPAILTFVTNTRDTDAQRLSRRPLAPEWKPTVQHKKSKNHRRYYYRYYIKRRRPVFYERSNFDYL